MGSNTASNESMRTIEGQTNAMVVTSSLSATPTSSSLSVSWDAPTNVCGTLTGYSVYLNSTQVHVLCGTVAYDNDFNLSL